MMMLVKCKWILCIQFVFIVWVEPYQFLAREWEAQKGFVPFLGFLMKMLLSTILFDSVTKTNKLLLLKAYAARKAGQKRIDSFSSENILNLWLNEFKFNINSDSTQKKYSMSIVMDLLNGKFLIKKKK